MGVRLQRGNRLSAGGGTAMRVRSGVPVAHGTGRSELSHAGGFSGGEATGVGRTVHAGSGGAQQRGADYVGTGDAGRHQDQGAGEQPELSTRRNDSRAPGAGPAARGGDGRSAKRRGQSEGPTSACPSATGAAKAAGECAGGVGETAITKISSGEEQGASEHRRPASAGDAPTGSRTSAELQRSDFDRCGARINRGVGRDAGGRGQRTVAAGGGPYRRAAEENAATDGGRWRLNHARHHRKNGQTGNRFSGEHGPGRDAQRGDGSQPTSAQRIRLSTGGESVCLPGGQVAAAARASQQQEAGAGHLPLPGKIQ